MDHGLGLGRVPSRIRMVRSLADGTRDQLEPFLNYQSTTVLACPGWHDKLWSAVLAWHERDEDRRIVPCLESHHKDCMMILYFDKLVYLYMVIKTDISRSFV